MYYVTASERDKHDSESLQLFFVTINLREYNLSKTDDLLGNYNHRVYLLNASSKTILMKELTSTHDYNKCQNKLFKYFL